MSTYSTQIAAVGRRGNSSSAAMSFDIGSARLIGMMRERISSFGAFTLTARFTRWNPGRRMNSPSRRMPSVRPTVEIETRLAATPAPLRSQRISTASSTASRLSMGSPMPMKTRLRISKPRAPAPSNGLSTRCRAANHCATISRAARCRMSPICAVSQKVQPMAQPTWLLTQSVREKPPPACGMGITTDSVSSPPPTSSVNLTVSPSISVRPKGGSEGPAAAPWPGSSGRTPRR